MNLKQLVLKYKKKTVILILLIIAAAGADIYAGYTLAWYYDIVTASDIQGAVRFSVYMILIRVFSVIMAYFADRYEAGVRECFNNEMKGKLIYSLAHMEYQRYEEKEPGEYASWLTNDIHQIEDKCFSSFFLICEAVSTVLFSIVALFYMHPLILATCIISTVILYFVPKFFEKSITESTLNISEINEKFSQKIHDTLSGFQSFVSAHRREQFIQQNNRISIALEKEKKILLRRSAKMGMYSVAIFRILEGVTCCLTAVLAFLKIVGIGAVFSVANISNRFLNGINSIFSNLVILKSSGKIFEKFPKNMPEDNRTTCPEIKNSIEVRNLRIKYDNHIVLDHQNYCFEIGKKYAIIGESGVGKSSMIKAMIGINDNYTGEILFDGISKEAYNKDSIFQQIAYISQEAYIFNDTIRFNLTLGDSGYTDVQLKDVLNMVNLGEFLTEKGGLDAMLGDNGKNISGGQKQRLAIARSLLQKKRIFVVDEGTSALDIKNVAIIERLLLETEEYTTILITHNMKENTQKYYDQVIHLKGGE